MPTTLNILRKRRKRRAQPERRLERGSRNLGLGCGVTLSLLLIFSIFSFIFSYQSLVRDLPPVEKLEILLNPRDGSLLQPTRLYDRSGENLIHVFAPEDKARRYIPIGSENPQHLPDALVQATIALSDPDFWTHKGYRFNNNPTITQKLVSDLLLWDEAPSLRRDLREILLASQLTEQYGRQQIIEWYLNAANFGHNAYGAESAAQLYFGKSITELDIAESATLAAASQTPALNPIDAPTASYQRRQETLYIMEELGMLDSAEADAARHSPFTLPSFNEPGNPAPAFLSLTLEQLSEIYPRERIERGGLIITSTLDLDLQKSAACTIQTQVTRLSRARENTCDSAHLLPALPVMDALTNARASGLILDPQNGQVLAFVGETTLRGESSQMAAGKIGSSLSPFVYLTGFTRGLSPASLLWDIPNETGIQNYDGQFHGPMRLRTALANDYRIPMEGVLAQMGTENVKRISRSFGVDYENDLISPLNLAQAYGVFAADGVMKGQMLGVDLQAVTVLEIRDAEGEIWLDWGNAEAQPVVTPQLAYLMNDILSDGSARWQSLGTDNALDVGFPAAAKIGRVADDLSAWTVGYTPKRVVLIWLSANEPFDPEISAGIWHVLIKKASETLPPTGWDAPIGITKMDVCDPSGLLPTADCPNIVNEVFLNGSEPSQYDNLYRSFSVNRETGYLATIFTSPALIEEKTYLVIPEEAQAWAETADVESPPTDYDAILAPPRLAEAHFTAPELFADISGNLVIRGTASGKDFDYYRVQVGQGLNPQTWLQIGEDVHNPVENDLLALWDTSTLSGLYAVQLLVVHTDQRVEIATTQISIDNEYPSIEMVYPLQGEKVDYLRNKQIEIQVNADDNLGVESVAFYLDYQQIGVLTEAPYAWTWAVTEGEHFIQVVARDRAGNEVEEAIEFVVER
ncbi:MAG: hypothetical protein HN390_13290 [Anaerolineae bacterium]|jgi:membrane peptidoglycan carboxypeptidase|nr:hypothetical protein [Anaerolineae bacterium]MBT7189897.1 hypothetical protein [Anaerolineae bacterium]MBT7991933.1 hypothetical protein [Anaerolineae bacterium]